MVELRIKIPTFVERPFIWLVLLYRRLRHGYPFRRIPLSQGKFAIVDPDDYEHLNKYKWHASKNASTFYAKRNLYPKRKGKPTTIPMHRQIMNPPDHMLVDHINYDGLDNRKANLRLATPTENTRHTRRTLHPGTSKYKGVSWYTREKRWVVKIHADGKTRTVGYFTDEIEAAKAYDKAAKIHHGEFAALNFPCPRISWARTQSSLAHKTRPTNHEPPRRLRRLRL
ncbi:MAG: HNH endonuclease [Planctomycetota bacterium]|jgi:hypothetical protein